MTEPRDAVIIGAGPAGSAAAIELSGRGHDVALIERDRFPRHKVCGEFLSPEALPHLRRWGLDRRLEEEEVELIDTGVFHLPGGRRAKLDLPRPALGVSRFLLDDLLACRARESGARLLLESPVEQVEALGGDPRRGFAVSYSADSEPRTLSARIVLATWGRWSPLDRTLRRPFALRTAGRFFGWNRHYSGDSGHLARQVHLHFFPGGYAGVSRVEKGVVNFAGVVAERDLRRCGGGWEAFTEDLLRRQPALAAGLRGLSPLGPFLGSPTVFFEKRSPVFGGMLAAGDAAGIRDSFSGSGQSSAIASGVLAARVASAHLRGEIGFEQMCRRHAAAWNGLLGRAFRWDAAFRAILFSRPLRAMAFPLLPLLLPRGFELTRTPSVD